MIRRGLVDVFNILFQQQAKTEVGLVELKRIERGLVIAVGPQSFNTIDGG